MQLQNDIDNDGADLYEATAETKTGLTPYELGVLARNGGDVLDDNPFLPFFEQDRIEWAAGWNGETENLTA